MQTLRNQKGFIQWIPLVICLLFIAYVGVTWSYYEIEQWRHRTARKAEERAKQEAAIEKDRIEKDREIATKQLEAIQTAYADQADINRRLIDENAKTADRIATAHERAADEIATSHRNMADMLLQWADRGATGTPEGILYLLGAVALAAVLGLVGTVFFLVRGRRYPEGPVVVSIDGGTMPGRIASGADVYRLIEHKKDGAG